MGTEITTVDTDTTAADTDPNTEDTDTNFDTTAVYTGTMAAERMQHNYGGHGQGTVLMGTETPAVNTEKAVADTDVGHDSSGVGLCPAQIKQKLSVVNLHTYILSTQPCGLWTQKHNGAIRWTRKHEIVEMYDVVETRTTAANRRGVALRGRLKMSQSVPSIAEPGAAPWELL